MPLVVQQVEQTDLQDAIEVQDAAFGTTSNIQRVIYPNGTTEYARAHMLKGCQASLNDKRSTCYKIVDTDANDRMVAWIDWKTFKDQPDDEWNKEAEPNYTEAHPDVNLDFRCMLSCGLTNLRRKYIKGKARVRIGRLTTHPEYHRRGAGKKLLDKCAEHADRLQLPIFLEASPFAASWYIRQAFGPIDGAVMEIDMKPFGYGEIHKTFMMKRAAKPVMESATF